MGHKGKPEGKLGGLVDQLKELLGKPDETIDHKEIVLKYLSLNRMAKKGSIQKMLGDDHWAKLQAVLEKIRKDDSDFRSVLQMGKKQDAST